MSKRAEKEDNGSLASDKTLSWPISLFSIDGGSRGLFGAFSVALALSFALALALALAFVHCPALALALALARAL